jgi:SAM-dependent methyltransferase
MDQTAGNWSDRICPVCGTRASAPHLIAKNTHGRHVVNAEERFPLYLCDCCDALFVGNIRADQDFYRRYYDDGYYDARPPQGLGWATRAAAWLASRSHAMRAQLCRRVTPAGTSRLRLLDVGCGAGDFLASLDPTTFDAEGLEINEDGRQQCLKRGLPVSGTPLEAVDFGKRQFDAVTLWHVVEHLSDPIVTLRAIRKLLSDDGVLVLAVPNHRCLGFWLGSADWFHLDSPRHLFIPSRRTIDRLAAATGFRVELCQHERWDFPLDLWWSVRECRWKYPIRMLYPLAKVLSRETLTFVLRPL